MQPSVVDEVEARRSVSDSSGWSAAEPLYRFMDCFQRFYLKKIVYLALPSPAAAERFIVYT